MHADAAPGRGMPPMRDALLRLVHEKPGIPVGDLPHALGVGWGTLYHHLARLSEERLVVVAVADGRRRVFPPDTVPAPLPGLTSRLARRIGEEAVCSPGLTIPEIARRLEENTQVVHYHVRRLADQGLLSASRGLVHPTRRLIDALDARLSAEAAVSRRFPALARPPLGPLLLEAAPAARDRAALRSQLVGPFRHGARLAEATLKVDQALRGAAAEDALRPRVAAAFFEMDLAAGERRQVVLHLGKLLPPRRDAWSRGIADALALGAPRSLRRGAGTDPASRLGTCLAVVKRCAAENAHTPDAWRACRDAASALLGGLDWDAPDAPRLDFVGASGRPEAAGPDGLAYAAILVELALAQARWARGEVAGLLPPPDDAEWPAWRAMLLATCRASGREDPAPALRPLENADHAARGGVHCDAMYDLLGLWPAEWVPPLASYVRDSALLDPAAASVVYLDAARVLGEAGDVAAAKEWLEEIDMRDVRRHRSRHEERVLLYQRMFAHGAPEREAPSPLWLGLG